MGSARLACTCTLLLLLSPVLVYSWHEECISFPGVKKLEEAGTEVSLGFSQPLLRLTPLRIKRQAKKDDESNDDYQYSDPEDNEDDDDKIGDDDAGFGADKEKGHDKNKTSQQKQKTKSKTTKTRVLSNTKLRQDGARNATTMKPRTTTTSIKQRTKTSASSSTTISQMTQTVSSPKTMTGPNRSPTVTRPLTKLALIAGKVFRYIVPNDTFTDPEEGTNLTLSMYDANRTKLSNDSWIQFLPTEREVYGLPISLPTSDWSFIIEATDSKGLSTTTTLDITVQQTEETLNHVFIMELELNEIFTHTIQWQIQALEGIINLLRNIYMEQLTVLKADQKNNTSELMWIDDVLTEKSECPRNDINSLLSVMTDVSGAPSAALKRAMLPGLTVRSVRWEGRESCALANYSETTTLTTPPAFPPILRNQVDLVSAMVGHLLVQIIPEDTFVDPEDGDTRNLVLSLRYSDNSDLPHGYWLQLDPDTQEIYGLPGPGDVGAVNYELVAQDSSKKTSHDYMVVEVLKAPPITPTAEFRMTLDFPFLDLAYSAKNKRRLIENLALLFGHRDTGIIRVASITDKPKTTVTWYNTSLPTDECPINDIQQLQEYISGDASNDAAPSLKDIADYVFDKDMKVLSLSLIPLGLCLIEAMGTYDSSNVTYAEASATKDVKLGGVYLYYDNSAGIDTIITFVIPAFIFVVFFTVVGAFFAFIIQRALVPNLGYPRVSIV